MSNYYVYILSNKEKEDFYVGVTNDMKKRVNKSDYFLVYCDVFDNIRDAIDAEKRLKSFRRKWKIDLIEKYNPMWEDLFCILV